MNNEIHEEWMKLMKECASVKDGAQWLEKFRDRRKRLWEIALNFDFDGLKDRCLKSNTLTDEDWGLVSYLATLVIHEALLRRLESTEDKPVYMNN